jgi:hypothetical protein
MKTINNNLSTKFNRTLYGLFIALAMYQCMFSKDYIDAASSMGIALIFDPFYQLQPWNDRPKWQKAWLLLHLGLAAALLGYGIGVNH